MACARLKDPVIPAHGWKNAMAEPSINISDIDSNITARNDSDGQRVKRQRQCRRQTLNLNACRLTDRELQVLLHAISHGRWVSRDRPADTLDDGRFSETQSMEIGSLLLNENPGIASGALSALWNDDQGSDRVSSSRGGSNHPSGGGNPSMDRARVGNSESCGGLFRCLVRLELMRCGLTAADLSGLAGAAHASSSQSGSSDASGGSVDGHGLDGNDRPPLPFVATIDGARTGASTAGADATICLKVLVLRDNPLTRVGIARQRRTTPQDTRRVRHWIKPASEGLDALRSLIARAPELDTLDLKGKLLYPTTAQRH